MRAFRTIVFTPGNHDLWLSPKRNAPERDTAVTSIGKLKQVLKLCEELGVITTATRVLCDDSGAGGVWIVPFFSWHHASFDTEPDIHHDPPFPSVESAGADFTRCKWPTGLNPSTESVAKHFDTMNDDCRAFIHARRCTIFFFLVCGQDRGRFLFVFSDGLLRC